MAREFLAGGGGRSAWRALKQAVVESLQPMAPRHNRRYYQGENAQQQKLQREIWSEGFSSSASSSLKAEMMKMTAKSSPLSGGWKGCVAKNYPEGLTTLASPLSCRRPDATMIQRSVAVVRRRCTQLISLGGSGTSSLYSTGGARKLHYNTRSIVGSPYTSSIVKRQIEVQKSRLVPMMTLSAPFRRNLSSSSGTTWTERWNKLRRSLSPTKQQGGVAASVGLKPGGDAQKILSGMTSPLRQTFSHYREAVGLQIEAFWRRNYLIIVGIVGLGVCLVLWRLMFGIASTFISMSEGLAKFGFLALAAAMVIVGAVGMRARFTINPDTVYRIAMRKLNTSAAVLEVMGAPLSGSDLRAYVMSGGGLRIKNFRPRLAGKRCFIMFPIQGAERRGLVSMEVKKKKGQYDFKLLAIDVPTAGADQRLYLVGNEEGYKVGGGLMQELRDPIIKAMAAQKELEELDMKEEEDEERKAMEAEVVRQQKEELDRLAKEKEAREQEDLEKSLNEEPLPLDEPEKPAETERKDAKPLTAQAG